MIRLDDGDSTVNPWAEIRRFPGPKLTRVERVRRFLSEWLRNLADRVDC